MNDPACDAVAVPLTARGPGGIAVVALRGADRAALAERLLRSQCTGSPVPRRATLWLDGQAADEVLVVERRDQVELHLHGAPGLLLALAREVDGLGEIAAGPARSLAAHAVSDAQLALALEQQSSPWSAFLDELSALSVEARTAALAQARARSGVALALARPQRLVLCGGRNAGKSTLMNRLLFDERVLAGAEAGLTRDPVRAVTALAGYPYELVDTAGEAAAPSELERRAIDRGRREREGALCVVVVDGSVGVGSLERELGESVPVALWVRNKIDLPLAHWPDDLQPVVELSCLNPTSAPEIRDRLGGALRAARGLPAAGPVGGPAALDSDQWSQLDELR